MKLKSLVFFFCMATSVSAQEMWGISNSNYSGNMDIFLNPSTIVAAPYRYEFFLIGADLFAQNSYMYSPSDRKIIPRSVFGTAPEGENWFDIYEGSRQNGFARTLVIGPSYINSNRERGWGFHMAYRNEVSVLDVPTDFAKYIYEEYNFQPFNGRNFSTGAFSTQWMRWFELGGTYGRVIMEEEKDYLKWAVSGSLLVGFDGLYVDARNMDYTIVDSSLTIINSIDAEIGQAVDRDNTPGVGSIFPIRGLGVSTTLGITYIHKRHPGSYECSSGADILPKYQYRAGLSIIDLGFIHYFNQDRILTLQNTSARNLTYLDSVPFISLGYLTDYLATNINDNLIIDERAFNMFTPVAISAQFDYAFGHNIYGNATLVNRIHYNVKEVARPNQLALSARYEKRKWEANLNYTLFEYDESALGLGLRYSFFVVGTDRLFEWLGVSDVQSFDFFFGIKFNFCDWPLTKKDCPAYMN